MFENIKEFFQKLGKTKKEESKNTAKERLHLVLAQDRANISADFLEMMKQEIIDVIKKYIDIDEEAIDVKLTNNPGEDGTMGAPSLYANIPIVTIKNEARKLEKSILQDKDKEEKKEEPEKDHQQETEEPEESMQEEDRESEEASKEKVEPEDELKDKTDNVEEDSSDENQQDNTAKEQEKGKEEKNEEKNS